MPSFPPPPVSEPEFCSHNWQRISATHELYNCEKCPAIWDGERGEYVSLFVSEIMKRVKTYLALQFENWKSKLLLKLIIKNT